MLRRLEPLPVSRQTDRARPHRGLEVFHHHIATQQYAVRISGGPAAEDNDRYAGRILATVLGDDSGSRLYWALVDNGRRGICGHVRLRIPERWSPHDLLVLRTEEAEDNLRTIAEIERELERHGVNRAELDQAKSKLCSQVILQSERPANRLFSVGATGSSGTRMRTVREPCEHLSGRDAQRRRRRAGDVSATANTTVAVGPLLELAGARAQT